MRAPVAAKGWPAARLEPLTLSFAGSIDPNGGIEAQPVPAIVLVFPCTQRAEHLRGEGFVDLVEVEVLQRESGLLEHARHGHGRRHEQAFAMDEIHGGHLGMREVGLDRQAARGGPFVAGQQHGCRAVGQARGVARGERALAAGPVEGRLERSELLERGIGTQEAIALQTPERHHQVVEETRLVRGAQLLMAGEGQFVLLDAADLPLLGHQPRSGRPSTCPCAARPRPGTTA